MVMVLGGAVIFFLLENDICAVIGSPFFYLFFLFFFSFFFAPATLEIMFLFFRII